MPTECPQTSSLVPRSPPGTPSPWVNCLDPGGSTPWCWLGPRQLTTPVESAYHLLLRPPRSACHALHAAPPPCISRLPVSSSLSSWPFPPADSAFTSVHYHSMVALDALRATLCWVVWSQPCAASGNAPSLRLLRPLHFSPAASVPLCP